VTYFVKNFAEIHKKRWQMSFHPEKCNVLTIRRKKQPILNSYTLHGHQLEQVTTEKYIGVSISLTFYYY
jgi:myo-inositol-hexaphosphate 3-phosphohydrolase